MEGHKTNLRHDLVAGASAAVARCAAAVVGLILMFLGIGMGVALVLLPLAIPVGFAGLLLFLWGLFGFEGGT